MAKLTAKKPGKHREEHEYQSRAVSVGSKYICYHTVALFMERKWQPTAVFLPGEPHGQRSLAGCHLWGHTGSDTTEAI